MAITKNERRERNGKITLFVILSISVLFGIYIYNFINTLEDNPIKNELPITPTVQVDSSQTTTTDYPIYMIDRKKRLYVGGDSEGKIQLVQGIEFQALDSLQIEYEINFLENWKSKKMIKGIANLDLNTVRDDSFTIPYKNGREVPAFQFVDSKKECSLLINISKSDNLSSSFTIVQERCKETTKDLTSVMFYK